ncbi:MAG: hypothetical protein RIB71_12540 [Imperialibacter sp.]|uniref:hypothetical protein n=1 Tax=Imperialibacter sp. TaxID=2038411 RepID=UPI0032EEB555
MNRFLAIAAIIVCAASSATAQKKTKFSADQKEVLSVVFNMFEGMRKADTTGYHKMFTPNVQLHTVMDREAGKESLRSDDMTKFFEAMAKPREIMYDEPLWDIRVEIDGRLAQVWTKYAFFAGDKFSHCGVDAFLLFKDKDGYWKIFELVDTRHFGEENCNLPKKLLRALSDL